MTRLSCAIAALLFASGCERTIDLTPILDAPPILPDAFLSFDAEPDSGVLPDAPDPTPDAAAGIQIDAQIDAGAVGIDATAKLR